MWILSYSSLTIEPSYLNLECYKSASLNVALELINVSRVINKINIRIAQTCTSATNQLIVSKLNGDAETIRWVGKRKIIEVACSIVVIIDVRE